MVHPNFETNKTKKKKKERETMSNNLLFGILICVRCFVPSVSLHDCDTLAYKL